MILVIVPQAKLEFDEIVLYYHNERPYLAKLFIVEINKGLDLLERYPESGTQFWEDYRRIMIQTFPYFIVYRVSGDEMVVTAFAHQHRKPDYWK